MLVPYKLMRMPQICRHTRCLGNWGMHWRKLHLSGVKALEELMLCHKKTPHCLCPINQRLVEIEENCFNHCYNLIKMFIRKIRKNTYNESIKFICNASPHSVNWGTRALWIEPMIGSGLSLDGCWYEATILKTMEPQLNNPHQINPTNSTGIVLDIFGPMSSKK